MKPDEAEWPALLRAANAGNDVAYERLLKELAAALRTFARSAVARGASGVDSEDLVQETLIAIHLKRGTWIDGEPVGPWIRAIARHKLIDALRRRGNRVHIPVHEIEDILPAAEESQRPSHQEVERHLTHLPVRQRQVVQAIALHGHSIRQTASQLSLTEGAVRVALHRGVKALAQIFGGRT